MEVQRLIAQHLMHKINTLLRLTPRHNNTVTHLTNEFFSFEIDIVSFNRLVQFRVYRLGHRRRAAAMRNEHATARPAQVGDLRREVRGVIVSHHDPPAPFARNCGQMAIQEVQDVVGAVRSFGRCGDREPRTVPATAGVLSQAELQPVTLSFEHHLAIRRAFCFNPRFV